jgi:trehalose 6-phosphate phosphatase
MPTAPPIPDAARTALLLDFDGTLVDIAPAPELVVVPDDLRASLATLRSALGGALAIVTGRPLDQVDHVLGDLPGAVAAEHGAVLRRAAETEPERAALAPVPDGWRAEAAAWAARHEGVRLEEKSSGFVLHYRSAPDAGPAAREFLDALIEPEGARFHVLSAKMAWELRASGADKGSAVRALMAAAPFAGRTPVFLGDDVTDEHAIDAARALGGLGFLVPDAFGEPADVRAWLHDWAELLA